MWTLSKEHLASTGETYLQHMRFALLVGTIAVGAGLACIIHAFIPALCQHTCSRTLAQLNRLFLDRRQLQSVQTEASGVFTFTTLMLLASGVAALPIAGGPNGPALILACLGYAFPAAFLWSNRDLEAVPQSA